MEIIIFESSEDDHGGHKNLRVGEAEGCGLWTGLLLRACGPCGCVCIKFVPKATSSECVGESPIGVITSREICLSTTDLSRGGLRPRSSTLARSRAARECCIFFYKSNSTVVSQVPRPNPEFVYKKNSVGRRFGRRQRAGRQDE